MSKFFNALAVAVLGIALLMGAAAAADHDDKAAIVTGTLEEITMSLTAPNGASLDAYVRGIDPATKTKTDTTSITSNAPWDLTIADSNIGSSSADGKMRKYTGGAYDTSPEVGLTNGFDVGITGDTLYDLSATAGSKKILNDQAAGTAISKGITYSQEFDSINDATAGAYRIDLTYSIAYNPSG